MLHHLKLKHTSTQKAEMNHQRQSWEQMMYQIQLSCRQQSLTRTDRY